MKLDRFINRPVLSTVISILIVILGGYRIGDTAYHAVSGHRASYRFGKSHLYGSQCIDRIEFRNCSIGGTNQRCRKHDVYDLNCVKHGFR